MRADDFETCDEHSIQIYLGVDVYATYRVSCAVSEFISEYWKSESELCDSPVIAQVEQELTSPIMSISSKSILHSSAG